MKFAMVVRMVDSSTIELPKGRITFQRYGAIAVDDACQVEAAAKELRATRAFRERVQ